jgi:two-component system, sensor histidine kinase LadS
MELLLLKRAFIRLPHTIFVIMTAMQKEMGICIVLTLFAVASVLSQTPVIQLTQEINNQIIKSDQYEVFIAPTDSINYTPTTVRYLTKARSNLNIEDTEVIYWICMTVNKTDNEKWFLEFLDAHTNSIETFRYRNDSLIKKWRPMGMDYAFVKKNYQYKNFLFPIEHNDTGSSTFLLRVQSTSKTSFVLKFRSDIDFISFAKNEYYFLGVFYGIVLITIITNLILFLFLLERVYLYYVLYLFSCSLLFLSEDTLGFEYLWPSFPLVNKFINTYSPILLLFSFYLYANRFLRLGNYFPSAKKYFFGIIMLCAIYFLVKITTTNSPADYRFYILPFITLYGAGIYLWKIGARGARYFVVAHSFVIIGIVFLIFRKAGIHILDTPVTFFSLNVGFVVQIAILSYALGERIHEFKTLRIKAQEKLLQQLKSRQEAQRKLVTQLEENQRLKDQLNNELEQEVQKRSQKIIDQNSIIALQNEELQRANEKLLEQGDKISKLNEKLDLDNWALKGNIKSITEARILSKGVDYLEFSKLYPDQDACLKFLSEKKWPDEYACRKCGNTVHCAGRTPFSRRCTKCRYEESATAFTLLHKCKFPLDKAFYAIFLIFSSRGKITSVSMAEKLKIRQSTCWSFMQKVNEAIRAKKNAWENGWDSILIEQLKTKPSEAEMDEAQLLDES